MQRDELLRVMDDLAGAVLKLERFQGELIHLTAKSGERAHPLAEDTIASFALVRAALGLLKPVYREYGQLRMSLERKTREALYNDLGIDGILIREER